MSSLDVLWGPSSRLEAVHMPAPTLPVGPQALTPTPLLLSACKGLVGPTVLP